MIYLTLNFYNPFTLWKSNHKNYICKNWNISKNKSFEFQLSRLENIDILFGFNLDLRWRKCDHAGPKLTIDILNYMIHFNIYDRRHWDYDNEIWG